MQMFKF